jgi:DnaJ-class molecular chaperone
VCDTCDGFGFVEVDSLDEPTMCEAHRCPACEGTGEP